MAIRTGFKGSFYLLHVVSKLLKLQTENNTHFSDFPIVSNNLVSVLSEICYEVRKKTWFPLFSSSLH